MNTERQYVYKYVDGGIEKYVGITNDLPKRFYQHTKDKLNEMKNPDVYYFPVKHRGDADMLETYLINYYNTGKYYNVAKTQKGDFSFFDVCDRLPWVLYDGNVNESLPLFSVSGLIGAKNTEVVYKTVTEYVDKPIYIDEKSTSKREEKCWNDIKKTSDYLKHEINCDTEVIKFLENLILDKEYSECMDFIQKGLYLHKKRLQGMMAYQKEFSKGWFRWNKNRLDRLTRILYIIRLQLEQHEGHKYDNDWEKDYYENQN